VVRQVWVQEEDEGQQVGADVEQDEEQVGADEEQDEVGAVAAANRRRLLPLPLPLLLLLLQRRQQQHQQQEGSPVEDPRAENATEGTVGVETEEMPSRHHHLLPRSYPPSRSRRP